MLTLKNVEVVYDDVILVLKGLSLHVPKGKIVALLGSNGAGKSTTLKAISGLLEAEDGEVTDGAIELDGERIDRLSPEDVVRRGIFQVMEGRRVFEDLTVDENLVMGGYTRRDRAGLRRDHDLCFDYFPRLKERRKKLAGGSSPASTPRRGPRSSWWSRTPASRSPWRTTATSWRAAGSCSTASRRSSSRTRT
jgi:branched-chain amino acid transport system ATP-binding protein